jgi:transcriptional regulator with XRE-family HTH domain
MSPFVQPVQDVAFSDELRRLRLTARIKVATAAKSLGWSGSKLSRIENARAAIELAAIPAVLTVYGVTDPKRTELLTYAASLTPAADRPKSTYLGYLSAKNRRDPGTAETIREWAPQLIPLFLRTEAYAEAVLASAEPVTRTAPSIIAQRAADIVAQQARITGPGGPLVVHAVIDECTLRRHAATPAVMYQQLQHLLDWAPLPNVEIRVLRHATTIPVAGLAALPGYAHVTFPPGRGVGVAAGVLIENPVTGVTSIDTPDDTYPYQVAFGELWKAARSELESAELVKEALADA